MASRRVLITGGTGFVGSHVAETFAEAGWTLRCSVRATSDTRWIDPLGGERAALDLRRASDAEVRAAVAEVEAVVHAAGLTRARNEEDYLQVNAEGTERLAAAAAAAGVRRFVQVSSLAARGPDGADGPVSAYGRSKREAERVLREAAGGPGERAGAVGEWVADAPAATRGGMTAVALRPGGIYGPRDVDLLPLFRMAASGWLAIPSGGAPLQPIYASDVARACLRAVETEAPGFGPWALAEERRYEWPEVGRALGEALGRRVRLVRLPAPVFEGAAGFSEAVARALRRPPVLDRRRARDLARHSWSCDPAPAWRALEWRPSVFLEEGLALTASWYREAGWLEMRG